MVSAKTYPSPNSVAATNWTVCS